MDIMSFEGDIDIKIICKQCGKESEIDEEKSNSNWEVHGMECKKCGGRCVISID